MSKGWCQQDKHYQYDLLSDFNEWLESDDAVAESLRDELQIDHFASPSKALFVGDHREYLSVLKEYRLQLLKTVLSCDWLESTFGDDHWYRSNRSRMMQLLDSIEKNEVIPFVGAGLSKAAEFPTWKEHLKRQGRIANLDPGETLKLIESGQYEQVIHRIEKNGYLDAFERELQDSFSHIEFVPEGTKILTELFNDTIVTTNYDRLIEHTLENHFNLPVQLIDNRDPSQKRDGEAVSVIKLHGDIKSPMSCIMSHNHYNQTYGNDCIDLSLPIPRFLQQTYTSSSLLFLGCSLNNDRTVEVFKHIKKEYRDSLYQSEEEREGLRDHYSIEQAPETEEKLVKRNQELLKMGVTPIWFPPEEFHIINDILSYALHEIRYRKAMTEPGEAEANAA